jgi:hypothetical protein
MIREGNGKYVFSKIVQARTYGRNKTGILSLENNAFSRNQANWDKNRKSEKVDYVFPPVLSAICECFKKMDEARIDFNSTLLLCVVFQSKTPPF